MYESPLFWPAILKGNELHVLDETAIPAKLNYLKVKDVKGAIDVIKTMRTRAFGQFLVVLNAFLLDIAQHKGKITLEQIQKTANLLNNSRPTFPFADVTGIIVGAASKAGSRGEDIAKAVSKTIEGFSYGIRQRRLGRVRELAQELRHGDNVLTHCNVSGELAMAAALAKSEGRRINVFATETRPYLQGAKLTVWELQQAGIDVTLVADSAIASLMADGRVNKVVIGSDRSAANGDIANKIGSYQIAVVAREFNIPVIALTQPSKSVARGEDMPIEERHGQEVLVYEGKKLFPSGVNGFYPGFDVVSHQLITKAITINAGL